MSIVVDTVPFGLLYPSLLYISPNTGTQWLDYFLGHAAVEMALRTRVLRSTSTQDSQAGVIDYPIEIPEGYALAYVERVCINGRLYDPAREKPCSPVTAAGACALPVVCATGGPGMAFTYNVSEDAKQISVDVPPVADVPDGVEIEISFAPLRNSCLLPRLLYERYSSAIINIALGEILLDPLKKTHPRTLAIVQRRAADLTRRAKQDGDSAGAAGIGMIQPPVGEFLI